MPLSGDFRIVYPAIRKSASGSRPMQPISSKFFPRPKVLHSPHVAWTELPRQPSFFLTMPSLFSFTTFLSDRFTHLAGNVDGLETLKPVIDLLDPIRGVLR